MSDKRRIRLDTSPLSVGPIAQRTCTTGRGVAHALLMLSRMPLNMISLIWRDSHEKTHSTTKTVDA
jgi:hypothetical protein